MEKLKDALNDNSIDEKKWQERLIPIILLLYPRYIICLKSVKIKRTNDKDKEIDYLLIDAEGNTMILELKKPFSDKKLLTNAYRKNFYQPKFELAGGIQQIESYIYDLNYDKKENIAMISKEYEKELKGIKINLIDTHGTLICGRSIDFNEEEKRDFEIIRKQYKNVVDIITYDELLERLNTTIRILKNQ